MAARQVAEAIITSMITAKEFEDVLRKIGKEL
jgi:hypothetical protein